MEYLKPSYSDKSQAISKRLTTLIHLSDSSGVELAKIIGIDYDDFIKLEFGFPTDKTVEQKVVEYLHSNEMIFVLFAESQEKYKTMFKDLPIAEMYSGKDVHGNLVRLFTALKQAEEFVMYNAGRGLIISHDES